MLKDAAEEGSGVPQRTEHHLVARLAALALALVASLLVPRTAHAVCAAPEAVDLIEREGETVEVALHGDERFSYAATSDGALVQQDPETGEACYVVWSDGTLDLGDPVSEASAPDDACTTDDLTTDDLRCSYKELADIDWEPIEEQDFDLVTVQDVAEAGSAEASGGGDASLVAPLPPDAATLPLLAIVVGFEDVPSSTSYDWGQTLFGSGSTLLQYYLDMSGGTFTFSPASEEYADEAHHDAEGDGVVHVTLDEFEHGNWFELLNWSSVRDKTGKSEKNYNEYMLRAFKRAMLEADPYVDFSSYDTNGNGTVETSELAICFVVAGYEGAVLGSSYSGTNLPIMWAHAWKLSAHDKANAATLDGVRLDEYIAISESLSTNPRTGTGIRQEPGSVLYHELGHYLGLMDLYPTKKTKGDWEAYKVGYLSLMAHGEWSKLSDGTYTPGVLDAWSRYQLGWIDPVVVEASDLPADGAPYTVRSQLSDEGYGAVLVRLSDTECYLIENRQAEGHDVALATHYPNNPSGVVIWHVDTATYEANKDKNTVNDANHRPAVMQVFAEYANGELALASADGVPRTGEALWSAPMWERVSGGASDRLYLPVYGSAETPAERTFDGVWIGFPSDPGRTMTVLLGSAAAGSQGGDDPGQGDDPPDNPPDDPGTGTGGDDPGSDTPSDGGEGGARPHEEVVIDVTDGDEGDGTAGQDDGPDGTDEGGGDAAEDGESTSLSGITSDAPQLDGPRVTPRDPSAPRAAAPARASRQLPTTGDLNLPIGPLAFAGSLVFVLGIVLRRRGR